MYYQNEPRFIGVYSRDNLPERKLERKYSDIGTHWIVLYANNKTAAYFDSFGVEYIPKEIKKFINNKNIMANIFKIQAYDVIMCGSFL